MVSILAIADLRGNILVSEYYLQEVLHSTLVKFIEEQINSPKSRAPPHMIIDHCHAYCMLKRKLLYIMISKKEISSVTVFYFLEKFDSLLQDFCGEVSVTTIETNTLLLTELMSELISINGDIQMDNFNQARPLIAMEPKTVWTSVKSSPFGLQKQPSENQPIAKAKSLISNSVYVDVIERLTVNFNIDKMISRFHLMGRIILKSCLPPNTQFKITLSESLNLPSARKKVSCHGDMPRSLNSSNSGRGRLTEMLFSHSESKLNFLSEKE